MEAAGRNPELNKWVEKHGQNYVAHATRNHETVLRGKVLRCAEDVLRETKQVEHESGAMASRSTTNISSYSSTRVISVLFLDKISKKRGTVVEASIHPKFANEGFERLKPKKLNPERVKVKDHGDFTVIKRYGGDLPVNANYPTVQASQMATTAAKTPRSLLGDEMAKIRELLEAERDKMKIAFEDTIQAHKNAGSEKVTALEEAKNKLIKDFEDTIQAHQPGSDEEEMLDVAMQKLKTLKEAVVKASESADEKLMKALEGVGKQLESSGSRKSPIDRQLKKIHDYVLKKGVDPDKVNDPLRNMRTDSLNTHVYRLEDRMSVSKNKVWWGYGPVAVLIGKPEEKVHSQESFKNTPTGEETRLKGSFQVDEAFYREKINSNENIIIGPKYILDKYREDPSIDQSVKERFVNIESLEPEEWPLFGLDAKTVNELCNPK